MANADKNPAKKPKLVRDSFTIPKNEFAAIESLKTRAIGLGTSVKKSELLRAGLMVLQALNDADFKTAVAAVPTLKTGRPAAEAAEPETVQSDKPVNAVSAKNEAKTAPAKAASPAAQAKPRTRTAKPKAAAAHPPARPQAATPAKTTRARRPAAAKKPV